MKAKESLKALLKVEDIEALLGLSKKGVYSLVQNRRIPYVKFSNQLRFREDDVVEWIRENRVPSLEK
jgi:excisionase family DNA binding protein